MVRVVDNEEAFDAAINEGKVCIIDFHATWCGPCKMIAPKLEALAKEYPNIIVLKVDVDEVDEVAQKCKVSAMPTFKVFKDGKEVDEMVGADAGKLEALFKKYN